MVSATLGVLRSAPRVARAVNPSAIAISKVSIDFSQVALKDPLTRLSRFAGFATLSPKGAREAFFMVFGYRKAAWATAITNSFLFRSCLESRRSSRRKSLVHDIDHETVDAVLEADKMPEVR